MARIRDFLNNQFKNKKETQQEVGIAGFTALVRVTDNVSMTSNVATTFLEDGSNVSDHIINNPVVLTISGDVSDVHVKARSEYKIINEIQSNVGIVSQYLPNRTQTQLTKISSIANDVSNAINRIDNAIEDGENILDRIGLVDQARDSKSNQEEFFNKMQSLHISKQLFDIEMPFKTYKNMAMSAIDISYDNEGDSTGFELVATQVRFAEDIFEEAPSNTKNASDATDGALDAKKNKGVQKPVEDIGESETEAVLRVVG